MKIIFQINGGIGKSIAGNVTAGTTDVADFSFIGGGQNNLISSVGASSHYGAIGGGQNNVIHPGALHASIFGGNANQVSGSNSAILGGSGNNDNGIPFTGMYGNGLVASVPVLGAPSAFWADTLVIPNIPLITTGPAYAALPIGALYYTTTGFTPGSQPVYVK